MRQTDTDQHGPAPRHRRGSRLLALNSAGGTPGGHTLIELMLALAVAAILAGAAAPAMRAMLEKHQLRAALGAAEAAVALTRSSAIARGGVVLMAPRAAADGGWQHGWSVFVDRNANRQPDPGEELIAAQQPLAEGVRLGARFSSGTGAPYLAYNASGRSCQAGNSQAARWGTLALELGAHKRLIKINMLGRVRVCDPVAQPATCSGAD